MHPAIGITVTKTYIVMPVGQEPCIAEAQDEYGSDYCGNKAVFVLDIFTVTAGGAHRRNRVAFCEKHISGRYRRWFRIS